MISKNRISDWLRTVALALLCLMPCLLALARAGADIAVCTIGVLFLLRSVLEKEWAWLKRPELRALSALWMIATFSSFMSNNPFDSSVLALAWIRLVIFYMAVTHWLLTTKRALLAACITSIITLVLFAIDTSWQYITGTSLSGHVSGHPGRLSGPMHHPNIGNLLLKVGLPMLGLFIYWLLLQKKRLPLLITIALALWLIAIILVSGERSSSLLMLLGTGATGGICFIYYPALRKFVMRGAALLAALTTLIVITQPIAKQRFQYLVEQLSDFWHTSYGQLYIMALRLWEMHPWFGIGAGQFRILCWAYMPRFQTTYCDNHPHNMYMEWLSATGILGLGLFVLAMLLIARRIVHDCSFTMKHCLPGAFACGTLVILIFPLIVTQSVFANFAGILFWYSLGLATCLPRITRMSHGR